MLDPADREFLDAHAPEDVRATVQWLIGRGYRLTGRQGAGIFGAAFTFNGSEVGRPVTVQVVVDRSQWMLDVSAPPDGRLESLDLLLEAHGPSGEPRAHFIAITDITATGAPARQLPAAVSWRQSLPVILDWLQSGEEAEMAIADVHRRRVEQGRQESRSTFIKVVDRGCEYCRDEQNIQYGHVHQVASHPDHGLLLRCPRCGWLYVDHCGGPCEPVHIDAGTAATWFDYTA